MLLSLKQFVPSEVCLKCDGCCRFKDEYSPWRPKISSTEIAAIRSSGLAAEIFAQKPFSEDGYILNRSCTNEAHRICAFFETKNNACKIYFARPFDCQLYPFVLTERHGQKVVCVHLLCPFVQEMRTHPSFSEYVVYLKNFFSNPEAAAFIRSNPVLIGDYSHYADELEEMFVLNLTE